MYSNSETRIKELPEDYKMSRRKITLSTSLVAAAFLIGSVIGLQSAQAQMVTKTMTQDDLFIIPGIGAIVAPEEGRLKVIIVPEDKPKDFADVDMETGDFLLMINGKRVKTVDDLRESFKQIEVGETLELGLKRDKNMLITTLKRAADDDTGGKMMVMTRTVNDGEEGKEKMNFHGEGPVDVVVIGEIGLILQAGDEGLSVMTIMPSDDIEIDGEKPATGAEVISVQGKRVMTVDGFEAIYDAVTIGEKVTIEYRTGEKTMSVSFPRREVQHKTMMMPK